MTSARIGCAGWTIPRELASAVPGPGRHLERYARRLSCTEINSSFHRSHKQQTWERWAASAPPSFRFAVKAPKAITHAGELLDSEPRLRALFDEVSVLGEMLGPVLFQLPPKLAFHQDSARQFLEPLRRVHAGEVALEPRHASWFEREAEELLTQFHISRVAADPPRHPLGSKPGGWRGFGYYRLHGSPRVYYSSYSSDFLRSLAYDITAAAGPVWCIFDNTASGAALGNAIELEHMLPVCGTPGTK